MRKLLRTAALFFSSLGFAVVAVMGAAPAQASTDDFVYDAWNVSVQVSTTADGRAAATITETLSPRFPMTDQNRGIVRGIPLDYRGADIDPREFTVTDGGGAPVPFETEDEDGFRVVLVGDDSFVHGPQTYVISYTLSDVVLAPDDGGADEFYWDLLDFEHKQPVEEFTADVSFAPELQRALDGNMRCYAGPANSTAECALSGTGTTEDPVRVAAVPLAPQEGVTVAIGMAAGTVVQPPQRLPNFALDTLPIFVSAAGIAAGSAGAVSVSRFRKRRRTDRGTIIAQYDVPSDLPPLIAAPVFGAPVKPPMPAQIVHLAVIGATQLADGATLSKKGRKQKATQIVRVVDPSLAADELDRRTLDTLVPGSQPGSEAALPKKSDSFALQMSALTEAGKKAAYARGYLEKARAPGVRLLGLVTLAIGLALVGLGFTGLMLRGSAFPFLFVLAGFVTGLLAIFALAKHEVHTRRGAEAQEYLQGVKLFIEVAEADRIRTLQSHSGAERREVDGVAVIHLYERLLPYAMLFNLEKEWSSVLEARYTAESGYEPHWYPGIAAYGFVGLSDSLGRYTDSITNAVSYSSSSSGGSTGGGFAGGGGGGGFSGGR